MIGIAILFAVLGIMIKHGKMYNLIAGYNTLPKKEQEKIDIARVATVFRNTMLCMALGVVIGYCIAEWTHEPTVEFYTLIIVTLAGALYMIVESNSKKYKLPGNN